jgi:hypothetical protein
MTVRPGQNVTIVLKADIRKEALDVRNSTVYDTQGANILVAQTQPPIRADSTGQSVIVTYMAREKGRPVRNGFHARILGFIADYELSAGNTVKAVILEQKKEAEPYNLRMYYRIEPPSNSNIDIVVNGKKVNLLDISMRGARFSHSGIGPFELGTSVKVTLRIDDQEFQIEAKPLRIWHQNDGRNAPNLEFVSVEFPTIEQKVMDLLGRKIIDIERKLRFREIFR